VPNFVVQVSLHPAPPPRPPRARRTRSHVPPTPLVRHRRHPRREPEVEHTHQGRPRGG
jgi:hypothetical protein